MPLQPGKSKQIIAKNVSEFSGGKTYRHTKKKFGAAKARQQAVAASLNEARKSGAKAKKASY